ncbi:MAG: TiaS agmantine-binding domain-containing protein, partial [Halobacteriota archaeon]
MKLAIGIDDTDSRERGMCTTYLAAVVAERLSPHAVERDRVLFRLNPNAPHRTRGNAALALYVETERPDRVRETVVDAVDELAVIDDPNTNPGVAFHEGDVPQALADEAIRTVREIRDIDEVRDVAGSHDVDVREWGNGRGVIGAVAALGSRRALEAYGDETCELIGYRRRERWGKEREYGVEGFREIERRLSPEVFDTYDDGAVAVPSTPCPVLYGLRGTYNGVIRAASYLDTEDVARCSVYRTNQATDMHVVEPRSADALVELGSYAVRGRVTSEAR